MQSRGNKCINNFFSITLRQGVSNLRDIAKLKKKNTHLLKRTIFENGLSIVNKFVFI